MPTKNNERVDLHCAIPGCDSERRVRGHCMKHHLRRERGLPMTMESSRGRQPKHVGCNATDCKSTHYALGYCRRHHARFVRGTPLDTPYGKQAPRKKTPCAYGPCDRDAESKGYCGGHYQQVVSGRELGPVHTYIVIKGDENGRICTECFTWKEWSDFYRRKSGAYWAKCKRCVTAKASIHQYEREPWRIKPQWAYEYLEGLHAQVDHSKV